MPSAVDGVQVAKATTSELESLKTTLSSFAATLREGSSEAVAIENLEKLVPEFRREANALKAAE